MDIFIFLCLLLLYLPMLTSTLLSLYLYLSRPIVTVPQNPTTRCCLCRSLLDMFKPSQLMLDNFFLIGATSSLSYVSQFGLSSFLYGYKSKQHVYFHNTYMLNISFLDQHSASYNIAGLIYIIYNLHFSFCATLLSYKTSDV